MGHKSHSVRGDKDETRRDTCWERSTIEKLELSMCAIMTGCAKLLSKIYHSIYYWSVLGS